MEIVRYLQVWMPMASNAHSLGTVGMEAYGMANQVQTPNKFRPNDLMITICRSLPLNRGLTYSEVPNRKACSLRFFRFSFHPACNFSCDKQKIPPCSFINLPYK